MRRERLLVKFRLVEDEPVGSVILEPASACHGDHIPVREDEYLPMRIIVADHHSTAQKALVALLLEQPGLDVIGEAQEMDRLLELVTEQPAHVVLLDHDLPGDPLFEMIDKIHALDPELIVIVMSSDPEHARQALSNQADAFVSKGDPPEWLLSVLKRYDLKEPLEKHEE